MSVKFKNYIEFHEITDLACRDRENKEGLTQARVVLTVDLEQRDINADAMDHSEMNSTRVLNGHVLELLLPPNTDPIALRDWAEANVQPLAVRILNGYTTKWVEGDHVAVFTEDAAAAKSELISMVEGSVDGKQVPTCDVVFCSAKWFLRNIIEIDETYVDVGWGTITTKSSNDDLDKIQGILEDEATWFGYAVRDFEEYLFHLRDQLNEEPDDDEDFF